MSLELVDYSVLRVSLLLSIRALGAVSRIAKRFFNERFSDRWIGYAEPIAWSDSSTNLNLLNFDPRGHLKTIVYYNCSFFFHLYNSDCKQSFY